MRFVFPHFIMAAIRHVKCDEGSGQENIKTLILDLFFQWFLIPLIPQTLSRPVSHPNMLFWTTALFQFHYTLY